MKTLDGDVMENLSLYGHGFVGREFTRQFPETVVVQKGSKYSPTTNILYGISTVHNYHPTDLDFFTDIDTNLVHFMEVLEANHDRDIVFNLISTWFVYGNTRVPAKEDSPCNPKGFYSITARTREELLISYAETFGIKYRILRLGNVIGVGDQKISRRKNALQYIVSEIAKGRDVNYLYKDGAVRDFIDVRDCARAIHLVCEKGELNSIYNIANGEGKNINLLVDVAHRESKFKSKITMIDVPEFHKTVQTPMMYMDVSKLKSLGYVQQHDIKQTVRELVHHYEKAE